MNTVMYLAEEATSQGRVMSGLIFLGALVLIIMLIAGSSGKK